MDRTGFFSPLRSPLQSGRASPGVGIVIRDDAGPVESDFSAMLLAMAGHDLRQPLQVITSAHDVLAHTLRSRKQREELVRAAEATAQLADMLGQLVEAVQLRQRSGDHLRVPVQLRPVLEGLAAEFAVPARLKGITFRVTSAGGAALSHPVILTGMLRNLIRNAIEYTPSGGSVFVASRRFGSELRLEVRDTGIGIRPNVLPRIFDAFRRSDQSLSDGLGLGLFIVKHAAQLLGHRVDVSSVEGRGSCFAVVADTAQQNASKKEPDLRLPLNLVQPPRSNALAS
jgi:two-component system phosphate regulon sensor histidine kinase PhoR